MGGATVITMQEVTQTPSVTSFTDTSLLTFLHTNIQKLHISHQPQITNEGIVSLFQNTSTLKRISDLVICCCSKITGDILPVAMASESGIRKFVLFNQPVSAPGQHPRATAQWTHIQESSRSEVNEQNLLAAIQVRLNRNRKIENAECPVSPSRPFFPLEDFRIALHGDVNPDTLVHFLRLHPTITTLKLAGFRFDSNFIANAISALPRLRHLHIMSPKCSNEAQRHILNGELRISHPTLQKLSLGYLCLSKLCFFDSPSATKLKIVRCSFINTTSLPSEQNNPLNLSAELRQNLRKLSLEHVRFENMDDISHSLLQDFRNLTTLRLIGVNAINKLCIFEMPQLTQAVIHQLVDLQECQVDAPELRNLSVEYCMAMTSLELDTPKLNVLFLFSLPLMSHQGQIIALNRFKLFSNNLRALNLFKCSKLTDITVHCSNMSVLSLPVLRFTPSQMPQLDLACPNLKALTAPYDCQEESLFHFEHSRLLLRKQCPNISALNIICTNKTSAATTPTTAAPTDTAAVVATAPAVEKDDSNLASLNESSSLQRQNDDTMVQEIFNSWSNTRVLVIRNTLSLTSATLHACTQYVMFYGCPNLRSLSFPSIGPSTNELMRIYLDNCASISDEMLSMITSQCPILMMLRVTNCPNVKSPSLEFSTFDPVIVANEGATSVSSDSPTYSTSPTQISPGIRQQSKTSTTEVSILPDSRPGGKQPRKADPDKVAREITFSGCNSLVSVQMRLNKATNLENEAEFVIHRIHIVNCASFSVLGFQVLCASILKIRTIQIDQCPSIKDLNVCPNLTVGEEIVSNGTSVADSPITTS